jgi:hypothetical protein
MQIKLMFSVHIFIAYNIFTVALVAAMMLTD